MGGTDAEFEAMRVALAEAREALAHTEARWRILFESAPTPIYLLKREGADFVVVAYNAASVAFSDGNSAKVVGRKASELYPDRGDVREDLERCFASRGTVSRSMSYRLRTNGATKELEVTYVFLPPDLIAVHTSDITQSKTVEKALASSEERQRSTEVALYDALVAARMVTFEWYRDAENATWSGDVEALFGDDPNAGGDTLAAFVAHVHPEDREPFLARLDAVGPKERATDGFEHEYRIIRADGQVRWVHMRARAFLDNGARGARITGTLIDVSERKRLAEELRESQRVEGIGRLAGGVAHDFNNLLGALFTSLTLAERGANASIRGDLAAVRTTAERAAELTSQLLALARKQVVELGPLDLNTVLVEMEGVLRRTLGEKIEVDVQLNPTLYNVRADASAIGRVLVNLVVNAREAMPSGGRLTIETGNTTLDRAAAEQHGNALPGEYAVLAVTDTGNGMDAETRQHIFEPFFTTKATGTGLGLPSSYGLVKQLGGFIWVVSELGCGSTFRAYLPRAELPPEPGAGNVSAPLD